MPGNTVKTKIVLNAELTPIADPIKFARTMVFATAEMNFVLLIKKLPETSAVQKMQMDNVLNAELEPQIFAYLPKDAIKTMNALVFLSFALSLLFAPRIKKVKSMDSVFKLLNARKILIVWVPWNALI